MRDEFTLLCSGYFIEIIAPSLKGSILNSADIDLARLIIFCIPLPSLSFAERDRPSLFSISIWNILDSVDQKRNDIFFEFARAEAL